MLKKVIISCLALMLLAPGVWAADDVAETQAAFEQAGADAAGAKKNYVEMTTLQEAVAAAQKKKDACSGACTNEEAALAKAQKKYDDFLDAQNKPKVTQKEKALEACEINAMSDDECLGEERDLFDAQTQGRSDTADTIYDSHHDAQTKVANAHITAAEARGVANNVELNEIADKESLEYYETRLRQLNVERAAMSSCKTYTTTDMVACDSFFGQDARDEHYNVTQKVIALRSAMVADDSVDVGKLLSIDGAPTFTSLSDVIGTIIDALTLLIGTASLIFIVVGGFRMVVSGGDDTELSRAKEMVQYAVIGLVVTLLAYIIVVAVQTLLYR